MQRLDNVQTCLALGTVTVQVALITNRTWDVPLRSLATLGTAFPS